MNFSIAFHFQMASPGHRWTSVLLVGKNTLKKTTVRPQCHTSKFRHHKVMCARQSVVEKFMISLSEQILRLYVPIK